MHRQAGLGRPGGGYLEHPDAEAVAGGLGGIGWTNTTLGCANLLALKLGLPGAIDLLVNIEEKMGTVADHQLVSDGDSCSLKLCNLCEEGGQVHHNTIPDHALGVFAKDS